MKLAEGRCAPFIHSLIVDEWVTTTLNQLQRATELNGRTVNWSFDGIYRLTNETISADPNNNNGAASYTLAGRQTLVLPHPSRKRRSLDGARRVEGEPEMKNLTGPPASLLRP